MSAIEDLRVQLRQQAEAIRSQAQALMADAAKLDAAADVLERDKPIEPISITTKEAAPKDEPRPQVMDEPPAQPEVKATPRPAPSPPAKEGYGRQGLTREAYSDRFRRHGGKVKTEEVDKWIASQGDRLWTLADMAEYFDRSAAWARIKVHDDGRLGKSVERVSKGTGKTSSEYRTLPRAREASTKEADRGGVAVALSPTLAEVRDAVSKREGFVFSPRQVAEENEWESEATVLVQLQELASRGILEDQSLAGQYLFRYIKPKTEGKAARLDRKRRSTGVSSAGPADAVAGTGRGEKVTNKDIAALLSAAEKRGASWKRASNSHYEVTHPNAPGKKVLISSTPKGRRTVENDRIRIRRVLGIAI